MRVTGMLTSKERERERSLEQRERCRRRHALPLFALWICLSFSSPPSLSLYLSLYVFSNVHIRQARIVFKLSCTSDSAKGDTLDGREELHEKAVVEVKALRR